MVGRGCSSKHAQNLRILASANLNYFIERHCQRKTKFMSWVGVLRVPFKVPFWFVDQNDQPVSYEAIVENQYCPLLENTRSTSMLVSATEHTHTPCI